MSTTPPRTLDTVPTVTVSDDCFLGPWKPTPPGCPTPPDGPQMVRLLCVVAPTPGGEPLLMAVSAPEADPDEAERRIGMVVRAAERRGLRVVTKAEWKVANAIGVFR